jgi:predicted Zn-dependent protease
MRHPRIRAFAVLFSAVTTAGLLMGEEQPKQSESTKPQGLFDTLLDTTVKTAQKVDRIGLEMTRMTDAEESALGAEIDKEVLLYAPVFENAATQQRLTKLAAPLIEQRQRRAINYTVRIVDSDVVNAYSIAGGYVYITRAFLKEFPSDAAIVMALGHEVGHVDLRHCVEKVQYQAAGKKLAGDVAGLAQIAYGTLRSAYTKEQEFDADKYGFEAACKAGWRPSELLDFIRGLAAYENRQNTNSDPQLDHGQSELGNKLTEYLATHPPGAERVRKLEALADKRATRTPDK